MTTSCPFFSFLIPRPLIDGDRILVNVVNVLFYFSLMRCQFKSPREGQAARP